MLMRIKNWRRGKHIIIITEKKFLIQRKIGVTYKKIRKSELIKFQTLT